MAMNTDPIYSGVGVFGGKELTAANTNSKGTGTIGTDIFLLFTADVTNGSWGSHVRLIPTASVANTTTTATTIRIFISTKTTGATTGGTDTFLYAEISAVAQAADNSTAGVSALEIPINEVIPPGYSILATTHVAPAANTNWQAEFWGGNYTKQ